MRVEVMAMYRTPLRATPSALTTLSAKVYMLSVLRNEGHNAFNSMN